MCDVDAGVFGVVVDVSDVCDANAGAIVDVGDGAVDGAAADADVDVFIVAVFLRSCAFITLFLHSRCSICSA